MLHACHSSRFVAGSTGVLLVTSSPYMRPSGSATRDGATVSTSGMVLCVGGAQVRHATHGNGSWVRYATQSAAARAIGVAPSQLSHEASHESHVATAPLALCHLPAGHAETHAPPSKR